jgi:hypothetical protein
MQRDSALGRRASRRHLMHNRRVSNLQSPSETENHLPREMQEMQDRRNNPLNSGRLTLPASFDDVG